MLAACALLAVVVGAGGLTGYVTVAAAACPTPGGSADLGADLAPDQGDETNPDYVWQVLRAEGLPAEAVAGIMGNLAQESSPNIDPEYVQDGGRGPGTGIAQWGNNGGANGSDRWNKKLVPWAKKRQLDEWLLSTQVSFMLWEMTQMRYKGKNLLAYMKRVTEIDKAVLVFQNIYEGCGTCMPADRKKYAQTFYNRYNKAPLVAAAPPLVTRAQQRTQQASSTPAMPSARVWPVGKNAPNSAKFGQAGSMWASGYHTGHDWSVAGGTPIRAAHDGRVESAGWMGPYGNSIDLEGRDGARTITTRYAHQSKLLVKKGMNVKAGQVIGLVGATGNTTGDHLHFELLVNGQQVDPIPWLENGAIDAPGGNAVPADFDEECAEDTGLGPSDPGEAIPNPDAGSGGGAILGTYPGLGEISAPIRHFTNSSHEYYMSGNRHSCQYDGRCMDLGAPLREPIYAMADGKLDQRGWSSAQSAPGMGFGMVSVIKHQDGSSSVYAHLAAQVGPSRHVRAGELIGLAGCTTGSRRPGVSCAKDGGYIHLHFEWSGLKKVAGGANPPFFTEWQTKCYQGQCDVEGRGRLKKKQPRVAA